MILYIKPLAKYVLSARIADDSHMLWVNLFDSVANNIIGNNLLIFNEFFKFI